MSRIRSVHPGQWTDSSFVRCSPLARLLAIGLRNECDDNGIFKLDAIELKIKILPADNCDINELIRELVETEQVLIYKVGVRNYGIVRSFIRFQKPKKPSFQHPPPSEPLPNGYELSTIYSRTSTEPVPNQFHTNSEPLPNSRFIEEKRSKTIPVVNSVASNSPADAKTENAAPRLRDIPVSPEFESVCAQHRVRLDAKGRMHMAQWHAEGITPQMLLDAIAIARERKPDPEMLHVGYLAPIVHELRIGTLVPRQPTGQNAIEAAIANIAKRDEARELAALRQAASG